MRDGSPWTDAQKSMIGKSYEITTRRTREADPDFCQIYLDGMNETSFPPEFLEPIRESDTKIIPQAEKFKIGDMVRYQQLPMPLQIQTIRANGEIILVNPNNNNTRVTTNITTILRIPNLEVRQHVRVLNLPNVAQRTEYAWTVAQINMIGKIYPIERKDKDGITINGVIFDPEFLEPIEFSNVPNKEPISTADEPMAPDTDNEAPADPKLIDQVRQLDQEDSWEALVQVLTHKTYYAGKMPFACDYIAHSIAEAKYLCERLLLEGFACIIHDDTTLKISW
jgi:hypothetical protein